MLELHVCCLRDLVQNKKLPVRPIDIVEFSKTHLKLEMPIFDDISFLSRIALDVFFIFPSQKAHKLSLVAKVEEFNKLNSKWIQVLVKITQYDKKSWELFIQSFSHDQECVDELFFKVKGS